MRILRTRRSRAAVSIAATVATVGALCVALAGITSAAPAATAAPAAPPACSTHTVVHTADGPVCGVTTDGVTDYLGIRYAAPPVGRLRFRSPQPVARWTSTFHAVADGNACANPGVPFFGGGASGSEDCLNLDVQVPAGVRPGARLPVMVEIHGGGFIVGAVNSANGGFSTNGTALIKAGHLVYVAMNYRLGVLGFLADKSLGAHSGDYGLQDQQAALRWVQRNIARFGGNPRNVTIFGQSAGGASVCDQVASPTARGLFQRGISQSGFYNFENNTVWATGDCKSQLPTEAQAQKTGAAYAAKVGCGNVADVATCLRNVPLKTLLTEGGQVLDPAAGGTIAPIVNGTTLTMSPGRAFATGHVNNVGLMIGVDRDEFNGGIDAPSVIATTPAQYRALVRQQFGRLAPIVERLYPLSRFPSPSPFIAYRTIMADSASVCPALVADQHLARHHVAVFAWEGDNADTPGAGEFPSGSPHVAENLFPDPAEKLDANQQVYQDQIIAQWAGYAVTGNPTVNGTPLWTRYTTHNRQVMSLVPAGDSALVPASTLAAQHNCGFWDAVSWPVPRH